MDCPPQLLSSPISVLMWNVVVAVVVVVGGAADFLATILDRMCDGTEDYVFFAHDVNGELGFDVNSTLTNWLLLLFDLLTKSCCCCWCFCCCCCC